MRVRTSRSHLRLYTSASLLLSLMSQMFWWSTPAQAQSILQQLFGLSPAPQARQIPMTARNATPRPITAQQAAVTWQIERKPAVGHTGPAGPEGSGSYTTVCVRMCDGYHFPISFRAPRSRFYHDAEVCRSRCGTTEARLFYHPSTGSQAAMSGAVDLTGRSYDRLPMAFMHRKKLVAGCGCRPEPWSQASVSRHQSYAIAAGVGLTPTSRSAGDLTVYAGNYATPDGPTAASGTEQKPQQATIPAAPADITDQPSANGEISLMTKFSDKPQDTLPTPRPRTRSAEPVSRRATAPRAPTKVASAKPKKSTNLVVAASNKLVWPGDAPTRTR